MDYWYCFCFLILVHTSSQQPHTNLPSVDRRIYEPINGTASCFRLTNATHQIGCSASYFGQRGSLEYVSSGCNFSRVLTSGPTPPYIVLLEQDCFVSENIRRLMESSPRVIGIITRAENATTTKDNFSPERSCPNDGFGEGSCSRAWNPYANHLLFQDFGDFPVITLPDDQFQVMLECYETHNANVTTGSFDEYPLCFAELTADMYNAINTPTCKRRENLPVNYLGGVSFCQNLGDYNVWGSPFNLADSDESDAVIMLAAKMDSVSLMLTNYSIGAQGEVAGIVTLLAVIEQIGRLRKSNILNGTESHIMYTFFNGESWDYIGSSSMVYDMMQGNFPYKPDLGKLQPPRVDLSNITAFLELSQLGFQAAQDSNKLFLHGGPYVIDTNLTASLKEELSREGINLIIASGRPEGELPPASLQRFLRAGKENLSSNFEGYVLADFNGELNNKFFGSQYDNLENLVNNSSLTSVAEKLAQIATAVTKTVLKAAGPLCNNASCVESVSVQSSLVEELLTCFLVNSSCSLFSGVTNQPYSNTLVSGAPLNRYVSVVSGGDSPILSKGYTSVIFQLVAKYTAFNDTILSCLDCWSTVNSTDQVTNRTAVPINETHCHCLESFTYMHRAESPALRNGEPASTEYSTWAESRWNVIEIKMYLVSHSAAETGVLIGGLAMTLLTLLVAIQCTRRADKLFQSPVQYDLYHVS
ncbi:nicastrin-like [Halichondria panicea]|uniref:nicastrin-like n=1 Tax=Halichondria panicea TaxID=6063 RepID=UPI00312B6419